MKLELIIEGKVLIIEAEGAVTVHIRDKNVDVPAVVPAPAPIVVAKTPTVVAPAPVEIVTTAAEVAEIVTAPTLPVIPAPVIDNDLFTKLSDLRKELAIAANVPAYTVFKDVTLREMAAKLPQDLQEFSNISGVGKSKLEKYGEIFLTVIRGAA